MKQSILPAVILTLLAIVSAIAHWPAEVVAQSPTPTGAIRALPATLSPDIQRAMQTVQADEMLSVIVTLKKQADLSVISGSNRAARQKNVILALRATASGAQREVTTWLNRRRAEGAVSGFQPFWIFNGFAVTATPTIIAELAARPDVQSITLNAAIPEPPQRAATGTPEPNLTHINAPEMWNAGFTGQGIVVALMDSGVDASHPDLSAQWRGGANSWFDPYGQHATPADLSGHGTQVLGVMVGRDNAGTSIGAAPDAQWIAVKIFNDSGNATTAKIHAGFQWLLDPDGNPNTADAPDVVNNSWSIGAGPGCNLAFQPDLQALLAAGILPIFSAGNYGPSANTSASPANYPEAFAVGAINTSNAIYSDSSRGPSACGEAATTYPELVAPGVNINTTDRFGFYATVSGTSIAAPHVSGGLALLMSAFPQMDVDAQRAALLAGAVRLTGDGQPDNNTGFGRVDVWQAYQRLADTRLTASAGAESVDRFQPITYTLSITHAGSATAAITVTGTFTGVSMEILQAGAGRGGCTAQATRYTCTLGILPMTGSFGGTFAGQATTPITIVAQASSIGTLTHTIVVSNSAIEATKADNHTALTITIKPITLFLPIVLKD